MGQITREEKPRNLERGHGGSPTEEVWLKQGPTMRGGGVAVPARIHVFAHSVDRTLHTEPLLIMWM